MSFFENNRTAKIITFLVILLLAGISLYWWKLQPPSHSLSAPVSPVPKSPEVTLRLTSPLRAPRVSITRPVRVLRPSPALPKEMAHGSVPAPMVPAVPVAPYRPYVPPPLPPPAAEPTEWQGTDTAVTHAGQIIVRTGEQWIRFWTEHHPHEASPDIDFSHSMVVGVFVGSRPADQFAVMITGIHAQADAVLVEYRERTPPTGTFEVGVTVYPYALKVVPRSALPIKFKKLDPVS